MHVYGVIYPHCLHHIRLVTASSDIIPGGHYSASAGQFIIEVAVGECAREKNKSLKMVIFGLGVIKKKHPEVGDLECVEKLFREGLDLEVSAGRLSPKHVEEVCL